jgi:hypothetical protein
MKCKVLIAGTNFELWRGVVLEHTKVMWKGSGCLEQYKEKTDTVWVFIVDDRTYEILVHIIKESVLLKRNDSYTLCGTIPW